MGIDKIPVIENAKRWTFCKKSGILGHQLPWISFTGIYVSARVDGFFFFFWGGGGVCERAKMVWCLVISKSMLTKDIHIVTFFRMHNVLSTNIAHLY